MFDPIAVDITVAIATLVAPAVFLATLAAAGWRRSRALPVGQGLISLVTILGGICLGFFLLLSGDILVAWPILAATLVLWLMLASRGAWRLAAWLVAGAATPWTVIWGLSLARLIDGSGPLDLVQPWLGFIVGAAIVLLAIATAIVKRAPAVDAGVAAAIARPTGRSFGDIGAAIRAPALVGPFGLSEVALLVALVATSVVTALLLPAALPEPLRLGIMVGLGAVLGAEAFIRAMPTPAREAFEAFSWLGEWELAQVRAQTGGEPPTNELAARRWLLANKETPELRWVRVEILVLAKQLDEARAVADRMVDAAPAERFEKAAARDFADWFAGGDGDLAAVEAAAADLLPEDGDARLRAEVAIAAAKVRRRIAAGVDLIAAGEPLRQVRRQLGRRADGQLGRALRWRLVRTILLVGGLFAGLTLLLPDVTVGL